MRLVAPPSEAELGMALSRGRDANQLFFKVRGRKVVAPTGLPQIMERETDAAGGHVGVGVCKGGRREPKPNGRLWLRTIPTGAAAVKKSRVYKNLSTLQLGGRGSS